MERYEIEAFLVLAEELHFGRTADRLGVSTAHVSKTIKRLEHDVGGPLFERTSRKVTLTPVGEELNGYLRPAYAQIRHGLRAAIEAGRSVARPGVTGKLRVGFIGAAAGRFLHRVADTFHARHPECVVQIVETQFGEALAPLRKGRVDSMLLQFPVAEPDITTGPVLFTKPRMLAVSARHPFARRPSVTLEDLARDKVLRPTATIPAYWDRAQAPPRTPGGRPVERGPEFATFHELLALVAGDQGIYPIGHQSTSFYARPDIVHVPFDATTPFESGLIWPTAGENHWVRAFAQAAAGHTAPGAGDGRRDTAAQDLRILRMLAAGAQDDEIARALNISVRTMRRRLAGIMAGLNARSRFQVGYQVARRGWLSSAQR